jgi:hypothetical protein
MYPLQQLFWEGKEKEKKGKEKKSEHNLRPALQQLGGAAASRM